MRRARTSRRSAVTLLEIVLAMGLLVTLSSLTYWFYSAALASREAGIKAVQRLQLARSVFERMGTELRQVASDSHMRNVAIRGEPERFWIITQRQPGTEIGRWRVKASQMSEPIGEFDLHKIEYKIARHPQVIHEDGFELPLGLGRVELRVPRKDSAETGAAFAEDGADPAAAVEDAFGGGSLDAGGFGALGELGNLGGLGEGGEGEGDGGAEAPAEEELDPDMDTADPADPLSQIHWEELYAPEIRYMRLCYYDGNKWWNDWDVQGERPLPQLIQVTIGFEPHAPYGQKLGLDDAEEEIVDRICDCMNEDPSDCEPLPEDQYTMTVRLEQADMFFRSRITRESQSMLQELTGQ